MKFTKMHGAGNDFVIFNNIEEKIPEEKISYLAKTVCQRRTSVGADGIMVVDKPEKDGDYKMRYYNADGSLGEMCGNGARCICRYGYEKGLAGEVQRVETTAGLVIGRRETERQYTIRLNDISVFKENVIVDIPKEICSSLDKIECTYVEMGNPGLPHVVAEYKNLSNTDKEEIRKLGEFLRYFEEFKKGANVNFYDVINDDEVVELTYERGVEDFTLACGTGTGSTVAVLTKKGLVSGKKVLVNVPGGQLFVTLGDTQNVVEDIFLTGPTNIVIEGELTDEDLDI